jgi:hypothetical protein
MTKHIGRFRITSYLQLRESDLFGSAEAGRIAQLSFFFLRRSFFAPAPQKFDGHRPPLQKPHE